VHELSLVKSVIDVISIHARENGWRRVTRVTLKVGRMRQVIPDVMKFSFQVASGGTSLEGAELEIVELPLDLICKKCGFKWSEDIFSCPRCGSPDNEIVHGMELDIDSVEVEEEDGQKDQHTPIGNGSR
jgi:hydrogenase nickel incorporation protein HypA/HybF